MARKSPTKPPTVAELSAALTVSETTIGLYTRKGMPRTSVADALRWKSENIKVYSRGQAAMSGGELSLECKRAEICQRLETARASQIKNEALEAQLAPRSEVKSSVARCMNILESVLASLPDRIASKVAEIAPDLAEVAKDKTRTKVELALREAMLDDTEDNEDPSAV